jgi:hypothetical protein
VSAETASESDYTVWYFGTGTCQGCRQLISVDNNGRLVRHPNWDLEVCDGSGTIVEFR